MYFPVGTRFPGIGGLDDYKEYLAKAASEHLGPAQNR